MQYTRRFIASAGLSIVAAASFAVPSASAATPQVDRPDPTKSNSVARSSCGDYIAVYAPPGWGWSRTTGGTCGHIDNGPYPQHYIKWMVNPGSSGSMCVRAIGYRWRDGKSYWASLGCGKSGGGLVHTGRSGGAGSTTVNRVQAVTQTGLGVPGRFTD